MDILTHTLSGIAIGTVIASFDDFGWRNKLNILLFSAIAGALPDIDAISLWSKFDVTIGNFFNLDVSGKVIYSSKYWYSHHGFFHSLFAALFMTSLLYMIFCSKRKHGKENKVNKNNLIPVGFFSGYFIHLLEDMPTPSSTWGGVNFFWPSKSYIGGTGDIWWWNNYDIFLIVVAVIFVNVLLHLVRKVVKINIKSLTIGVFVIGFSLALFQIKTRDFDFSYDGYSKTYQQFEKKSKAVQKEILGEKLYGIMEDFDHKLDFYF